MFKYVLLALALAACGAKHAGQALDLGSAGGAAGSAAATAVAAAPTDAAVAVAAAAAVDAAAPPFVMPPADGSDDCATIADRVAPVVLKETGDKMSADDRAQGIAECHADVTKRRSDRIAVYKCVLAATSYDTIKACIPKLNEKPEPPPIEAKVELHELQKKASVQYLISDAFPEGTAATLPAAPCCTAPDHKCPAAAWTKDPLWTKLEFSIEGPTQFQYSYKSDGKTVTATAVGDPDCTGKPVTYTLHMGPGKPGDDSPTWKLDEPPAR